MKNKDRTFLESMKRFLWPMKFRKLAYFKFIIQSILRGINYIIHILFLEKIVKYVELGDKSNFNDILLYYFIYIILFELIHFLTRNWGWVNTEARGLYDIYHKYLKKYIILDNNDIERIGTGKLTGIIQNGVRGWTMLLSELIELGIALIISIIFTIYMVGKADIGYGLLFVLLLFVFFYLSKLANNRMQEYRKERYEINNTGLRYLVRIIMSKIEILQSSKINQELTHIYKNCEDETSINKKMSIARNFVRRISQLGMALILLFSFYYFGNKVFNDEISISTLVGLSGVLLIMQKVIAEFISFYISFTKRFINVEKLWDFFDTTPQITGYEEGNTFKHKNGEIKLKKVTSSYTEGKDIFKNFDLDIQGEKVTAIVGSSGAGKTTLIKLISGYIKPNSGEIIIDGQKLSETSLKSYYKDIGYLTQEPSVFDGTVLDNLTYGVVDDRLGQAQGIAPTSDCRSNLCGYPNNEHLNKIINLAKCEFIYDLPNGINTEIGEKGVRLSGGQRQRLAIAKIFLKDPKIILLDEPTSALDSFSEELITKAMHNLFKRRTIIIIAHRLQTVKNADDIILLEDGKISERGTHAELVKQKGIYKKMLDLQSGF